MAWFEVAERAATDCKRFVRQRSSGWGVRWPKSTTRATRTATLSERFRAAIRHNAVKGGIGWDADGAARLDFFGCG
jgi:hypothetical protein